MVLIADTEKEANSSLMHLPINL